MPLLCFVFTILFLAFAFPFYSAHSFHHDGQSLLEFKKLITIDPHLSMGNWIPAVPLCNWTGVTCSHRHIDRVVSINLTAMNLGGTISPYLGNLTFLHSLDLSKNELRGHIPTKLGRLFRLRNLWLWENQLEGNIPQEMGSLTHLQQLLLSKNNLKGNIPVSLSNISTLTDLELSANKLTGNIPNFSNLVKLNYLHLWGNQLTGSIPNSIGNCSKLIVLNLSINKLSGSVPVELGKLPLLEGVYLHSNQLGSGTATTMPFLEALTNC